MVKAYKTVAMEQQQDLLELEQQDEALAENSKVVKENGQYYAVKSGKSYQIGILVDKNDDEEEGKLMMLKRSGRSWVYPNPDKTAFFNYDDFLKCLDAPSTDTGRLYKFDEQQIHEIAEKLKQ